MGDISPQRDRVSVKGSVWGTLSACVAAAWNTASTCSHFSLILERLCTGYCPHFNEEPWDIRMNAIHVRFIAERRKITISAVSDGLLSSAALLLFTQLRVAEPSLTWEQLFSERRTFSQCMLYITIFRFVNEILQAVLGSKSTPASLLLSKVNLIQVLFVGL